MKLSLCLLLICFLTQACQRPSGSSQPASTAVDSLSFDVFLDMELMDWERMPENLWMDPVFLLNFNSRGLIEKEISFADNTWLQLDVDGNGAMDEVGFLRSRSLGNIELFAFLRNKNTFQKIRLKDLGKINACCVAAGIDTIPPGEYFDIENEKMIDVPFHALKYRNYNESVYIYYFTDESFKLFQTID